MNKPNMPAEMPLPECQPSRLGLRTEIFRREVKERCEALSLKLHGLISPQRELVGEIGCGHGHFLTAYAQAHPEHFCVGIDIVRDRIARATRKANRARLSNLHFINAEAGEFLAQLPEGAKFSIVFVLFPDPWPKRRHHKNRLLQDQFLDALAERAGEKTRLYFRTDFTPYFAEAMAVIDAHPLWERVEETWPFETETVFQARASSYSSLIARRKIKA